jgi:nucleoside-diphosphate-sugar epimerase
VIGRVTGKALDVRYAESQAGDVMHTFADISLAARELGYAPRVDIETGIEREAEWVGSYYRRHARAH